MKIEFKILSVIALAWLVGCGGETLTGMSTTEIQGDDAQDNATGDVRTATGKCHKSIYSCTRGVLRQEIICDDPRNPDRCHASSWCEGGDTRDLVITTVEIACREQVN